MPDIAGKGWKSTVCTMGDEKNSGTLARAIRYLFPLGDRSADHSFIVGRDIDGDAYSGLCRTGGDEVFDELIVPVRRFNENLCLVIGP